MYQSPRTSSPNTTHTSGGAPITPYVQAQALMAQQQRIEQVRRQVMPVPLEMNWATWTCLAVIATWSVLHMGLIMQSLPAWLSMSTLDILATGVVAISALWGSRTSLMPTVAVALMLALSFVFGASVGPIAMILVAASCGVIYVLHTIAAAINPELLAQISKKS